MPTRKPFFLATANALGEVTRLYDFIWPTAVAIWNMRWMAAGYRAVLGSPSVEDLKARFVQGSGIHGANLHRAYFESTWPEQQEELARISLVNLFAIYESWAGTLVHQLAPPPPAPPPPCQTCGRAPAPKPSKKDLEKWLQFPSDVDSKGVATGVGGAIQHLRNVEIPPLRDELRPVLSSSHGVHPAHLDDLLVIFRYFKECRNVLVHGGGRATKKVVDAADAVAELANKNPPFSIPQTVMPTVGAAVAVGLYGVVGFSDIVQRTMSTIDAELSSSGAAKFELVKRFKAAHGTVMLKADKAARRGQLRRKLRYLGLPNLPNVDQIDRMLQDSGILQ
jgi:hypothetical protein